jgi:hypothetical protein
VDVTLRLRASSLPKLLDGIEVRTVRLTPEGADGTYGMMVEVLRDPDAGDAS